jgi:hypothetical protein
LRVAARLHGIENSRQFCASGVAGAFAESFNGESFGAVILLLVEIRAHN